MKHVAGAVMAAVTLAGCDAPEAERDPLVAQFSNRAVIYDLSDDLREDRAPPEQSWAEDGTTVYDTKLPVVAKRHGRWKVRNGQYCEQWGPQEPGRIDWTCWNVSFPAPGHVGFAAPSEVWLTAPYVEGRYTR